MGAQRWISIGSFNLQPSEFARMVVALILAMYFGENRRGAQNTSDLVIGGIFTAMPLLLIAKQPDLGTAVTLLPVFFGVAYLAGLRMRLLAVIAIAGLLLARSPGSSRCRTTRSRASRCSSTRARTRRGAGYQTIQARITVGSGGLTGKGLQRGHAGAVRIPPGRPQRLHLLGAGRGAGFCRRAGGARALPVRNRQIARGGAAGQGPPRRLPGRRDQSPDSPSR